MQEYGGAMVESAEPVEHCDAVVIGAGVIGAAVALELARSGHRVVVVDKGPGAGTGTTSASSAIIRFSYSTRDAILTAWEGAALWENWAEHLGHADPDGLVSFTRTGNVVFRTVGFDGNRMSELWTEFGIDHELLDPDEIARRWPFLDVGMYHPPKPIDDPGFADDAVGRLSAWYQPDSGFIDDPTLAARNLAYAARQHGAEFRYRTAVASIDRTDRAVSGVTFDDGTALAAPVVVNAAGPWAAGLNRMAGVTDDMNITTRALRAEVFMAPAPEGARVQDGAPLVADLDVGQYFRPQHGDQVWIGGAEPDCDPLHWVDDPDTNSHHPTVEVWETSMLRFARRVPQFGIPTQPNGIASMYDASDDWVPIYDRSSLHGFFMACGTSGNQFKNAPMAGLYLREIIDATMSGHDHDADPVQFRGVRTGLDIDLGAFSRRRTPAATTNTVMG